MDKNAIKKYAVWARRELIERVTQKAQQYEISVDADPRANAVRGKLLSKDEKDQRSKLILKVKKKGYNQVMEEVAYTWFNRFAALRFMEVNGYLPSHMRVFTDDAGAFKPQILSEAIHLDLDGLNKNRVYELKNANKEEGLFKYLLIVQCNALNKILPGMFQKIEDYTELLLPDNLLREGSVIQQMVEMISEDDWRDAVQIIGWLYQYYNTEPKDKVFAELKKNIKISKENIPAATQLFTPDWIVRYMVENSLGRLWVEGHPNDDLKAGWKYYLEEAEQEPEVQAQLNKIRKAYASMEPKDIKVIDPCCGSGHILVYLFDVLMQIYESYGYTSRDAVASILRNNLYGLDIDDRAAQLAYFAVMMKARQYDRRFFSHTEQPHVYAICESNYLNSDAVHYFCNGDARLTKAIATIREELYDAREYGSILTVTQQDWNALYTRFDGIIDDISMFRGTALNELLPLVRVAEALAQKYDTVVTNPPYMGSSGMSGKLSNFVKKHYPDSKSDLFAVFMERANVFVQANKFTSLITMESWMFLSSFEKLREKVNQTKTIINMVHMPYLGKGGTSLGINFGTAAVIMKKGYVPDYSAQYEYTVYYECDSEGVPLEFPTKNERWKTAKQSNFSKIPGSPMAYWLSDKVFEIYADSQTMEECAHPKVGMQTSNNDKYLRLWFEINYNEFDGYSHGLKWIKYLKGGAYRKWYGNLEYLLFYNNDKNYILQQKNARVLDIDFLQKKKCTWTDLTSGKNSFRLVPDDTFYDISGHCFFPSERDQLWLLAYANSVIFGILKSVFNSTFHCQVGDVAKIVVPIVNREQREAISALAQNNVDASKEEWDSFETSWDFAKHPLIRPVSTVADAFAQWETECNDRFTQLKANEEELNRIFIDIYDLQDELTPEVEDKDVTVCRYFDGKEEIPESMGSSRYALTKRDMIVNFISYAVGCMFGRYSLDVEGLAYAGGEWDASKYRIFPADKDNIIPVCDDEYFDDDIVGRFIRFVNVVFGEKTLQENLRFIADALGGKGQPKEVIRSYFLNDFFKDHCKTYQKRPIYWLFDSGKKNGFKALIYMHRYRPDTIARIRTDYVHEQQSRYRTAIADLERRGESASASERVKLSKALMKLQDQADELKNYEEKIHHLADQMIPIDLDDGVRHNYEIFKDVLAKIK